MWAPLPDHVLSHALLAHLDPLVHYDVYKILLAVQDLRTRQWRLAYWIVTVSPSPPPISWSPDD